LPVLLLAIGNYLFRFFKWDYYLKVLDIEIDRKMSFVIFFFFLIMSITPGKIGEIFKSYLLKEQNGTSISKSAPIILAERITDFISLIMLTLAGVFIFGYQSGLVIFIGIFFFALVLIISSKKLCYFILKLLENFSIIRKLSLRIHIAYDSIYKMVQIKELLVSLFLSILAWFCECYALYIVINGFGVENSVYTDIYTASFIFGFSIIAGAITMLPAGLGATDAGIAFLLVSLRGVAQSISVASSLIFRIATLWFAVIIGIVSVSIYQKMSHKKVNEIVLGSQ